jgi:hypothetical protein
VHPAGEDRLLGVKATRDRVAPDTQCGTGDLERLPWGEHLRPAEPEARLSPTGDPGAYSLGDESQPLGHRFDVFA